MLENINKMDLEKYWSAIMDWCGSYFWQPATLYQAIIIGGAIAIGTMTYGLVRGRAKRFVENHEMPATAKRIAMNLVRLIFPLLTLIIIFIAARIAGTELIGIDTGMIDGIAKVLFAWIVIRTAVQFIANSAMRNFFALVIWTIAALSIFGILNQTMETLDAIAFTVGEFRLSVLAVIKSILSLAALLYFAIFISSFAERRIFEIRGMTRSSQVLAAKITRITLVVTALLIGITSAGIDLSLFAVVGGAIGLGIGFGLQKVISNLFSGLLLLLDKSIKPGDVIEIPDIGTFGWVNQMSARYTEIVTRDNKSFLIPNEDFITQRVVNWSHGNSLIRVNLDFGVHYESDMEKVVEVAIEATKVPDRVVDYRQPVCWMTEFGDSSVNFSIRFWIKDAQEGITNVKGEVMMELWKAFKENDIAIPYPHREVFLHEAKK
ncbi:MAG: mechanosensitive ion channel domain-containing protein [Pseudomonadota bacterium]